MSIMLETGTYNIPKPKDEIPSVEERLARLRECGYPCYHLFGSWYIGREYSVNARKWSWWTIFRMK